MKQYGFIYNNFDEMKSFVDNININETDTILIQIMTGVVEAEFIKRLIYEITSLLPSAEVIGATTSGEILEGNIYANSTIFSITIFEKSRLKTALVNNESDEYKVGIYLVKEFIEEDTKAMIMFSDGVLTLGDDIIKGIKDINSNVIICGGKAGDNDKLNESFIFTKEGILNKGIAVAFLSGKDLRITTESSFCWLGIGKEMTITKAVDNTIFTIDNIIAEDIFKKYLGDDIFKNFQIYSTTIPLIIKREGMDIARVPFDCNKDGSISFLGKVEAGDKIQFGHSDIKSLTDKPVEIFNNLKKQSIEGIFIYSCSVRKALLQNSTAMEITPLTKIAPTCGFFTYGEFSSNGLANLTMTILGISEGKQNNNKNTQLYNNKIVDKRIFEDKDFISKKIISNLVNEVTKELKQANETLEEQKNKIEKMKNITNSIMDINMKIISSEKFDSLLQMILDKALEIISGGQMGSILLMKDGKLSYTATKGYFLEGIEEVTYKLEDMYQYKICGNHGMCEAIIIREIEKYPLDTEEGFKDWIGMLAKNPSEILTCGISIDGKLKGIINIFNTENNDKFNEDDKILIKHLANDISLAYKNSKLLETTLYMSRYDGLTGVFNRHYFRKKLVEAVNNAKSKYENVIICELDLNNLKITNDTLGHEAGDSLIKYFSTIFKTRIGRDDIMGRTGGDEFEIIFVNKNKSEVIEVINDVYKICKNKPINYKGKHIEINFAFGLAELFNDSENIGELLKLADNRMYENKRRMKEK